MTIGDQPPAKLSTAGKSLFGPFVPQATKSSSSTCTLTVPANTRESTQKSELIKTVAKKVGIESSELRRLRIGNLRHRVTKDDIKYLFRGYHTYGNLLDLIRIESTDNVPSQDIRLAYGEKGLYAVVTLTHPELVNDAIYKLWDEEVHDQKITIELDSLMEHDWTSLDLTGQDLKPRATKTRAQNRTTRKMKKALQQITPQGGEAIKPSSPSEGDTVHRPPLAISPSVTPSSPRSSFTRMVQSKEDIAEWQCFYNETYENGLKQTQTLEHEDENALKKPKTAAAEESASCNLRVGNLPYKVRTGDIRYFFRDYFPYVWQCLQPWSSLTRAIARLLILSARTTAFTLR